MRLTAEKQIQAGIVRLDMAIEGIWRVMRVALPVMGLIAGVCLILHLWKTRKK